ncbi:hypothetical protein Bbelb_424490 [Branchiostoma belcheri]|nr:hypothetical protein Bbelb_424490 [Branchiostoma belcheri]
MSQNSDGTQATFRTEAQSCLLVAHWLIHVSSTCFSQVCGPRDRKKPCLLSSLAQLLSGRASYGTVPSHFKTMEVPEPKKFRRSCFLSHLADVPLVKTATANVHTFYTETKERSLLFRAWASMAELVMILAMWGANKTVGKWCQAILRHEGEAQLAAAIDTYACVKLQQLEVKFPVLTKSADVVAKKATQKVLSVAFLIPRWMLETRLGKIAVFGLDKTLQLSVTVADLLQPEGETEEDAAATAENKSVTIEKTKAPPAPEPDLTALVTGVVRTTATCARGLFPTLYGWFILTPLLLWADPDTKAKISSRRRMSPRKRIPSLTEALAQYIPKKAFSMLGLTTPPAEMTMPLFGTRLPEPGASNEELRVSPNMEEGEKRKRSTGKDEDETFLTLDLENYRSDDDPDYQSESSSSTDSYEYISSHHAHGIGEPRIQQGGEGWGLKPSLYPPPLAADSEESVSKICPADSSQPTATSSESCDNFRGGDTKLSARLASLSYVRKKVSSPTSPARHCQPLFRITEDIFSSLRSRKCPELDLATFYIKFLRCFMDSCRP